MKNTSKVLNVALVLFSVICWNNANAQGTLSDGSHWHWEKGTIVVETPQRPAGQTNVLNLTTPKLKVVRVGFVGTGGRGTGAVERWVNIPGVQIVAFCDHEKERAENCQQFLKKAHLPEAAIYYGDSGYVELCKRPDIDLVYIATDWLHHVPVALCAMNHGKHAAIEVPSAMNMKDIWDLINTSERTRKHCMLLENCVYDWFEMNTLNMAQKGLFGEILHVSGAYRHCLDPFWDEYWKKDKNDKLGWRLEYNMLHRGDVYATHGLGPIAQLLNIHRGDRMKTLVAMDTKSVTGKRLVKERTGQDVDFRNGDYTQTMIRTENGKLIDIHHDVMNPEPYNRMYQLVGTNGFANKYPSEGYALSSAQMKKFGLTPSSDNFQGHDYLPTADKDALVNKFYDPILKKYGEMAKKVGGHGGMDFIEDCRLVYCLRNGLPLDIDVYDLAEWCCLAELGALSMDNGCVPVTIPDFTRGHWNDIKGYSHAFVSDAEDAATEKEAEEFTANLKRGGEKFLKKYWKAENKKAAKSKKRK